MLPFFRKIRKALLDSGRLSRYLIYAIGEILLVVIGILIALQINNWNEDRKEHQEEVDIISRLMNDIQKDVQLFNFQLESVKEKEESLLRVKNDLSGSISEPIRFLEDIIDGADFGWNQVSVQRSTYDELLGAGKLGIIANSKIRLEMAEYYREAESSTNRIDERETFYPNLSYQLVPRNNNVIKKGIVAEKIENDLSALQIKEIIDNVRESEIMDHVTSEINLARFIQSITIELMDRAESLSKLLLDYQKEIR